MKPYKIEDIYPLTIVGMKHGKFAIVNALSEASAIGSLAEDEEWQYSPHVYMRQEWKHINYGIGDTIAEAFEDFKERYK
jgi:hypothetical protein